MPSDSPARIDADSIVEVLIVDDDAAVSAVVARQLRALGWTVAVFNSGAAALTWLSDAPADGWPTLVVSDLDMPELSGLELTSLLRRSHPALGVLLLSGRGAPGLTLLPLPGHAPAWLLGKPYDLEALADAVRRTVLAHWGAPGEQRSR